MWDIGGKISWDVVYNGVRYIYKKDLECTGLSKIWPKKGGNIESWDTIIKKGLCVEHPCVTPIYFRSSKLSQKGGKSDRCLK